MKKIALLISVIFFSALLAVSALPENYSVSDIPVSHFAQRTEKPAVTEDFNAKTAAVLFAQTEKELTLSEMIISGSYDGTVPRSSAHFIDFAPVCQLPELPTGCEITALAQTLNHLGYDVSKLFLADNYLITVSNGMCDYTEAFVGDPRDALGWGCSVEVIEKSAQNYLDDIHAPEKAHNLRGAPPDALYSLVEEDIPVIVWATDGMREPDFQQMFIKADGTNALFPVGEHCMTLVGFDKTNRTVSFANPMNGRITPYDMDLFEKIYAELGSQALIIQ